MGACGASQQPAASIFCGFRPESHRDARRPSGELGAFALTDPGALQGARGFVGNAVREAVGLTRPVGDSDERGRRVCLFGDSRDFWGVLMVRRFTAGRRKRRVIVWIQCCWALGVGNGRNLLSYREFLATRAGPDGQSSCFECLREGGFVARSAAAAGDVADSDVLHSNSRLGGCGRNWLGRRRAGGATGGANRAGMLKFSRNSPRNRQSGRRVCHFR